MPSNPKEIRKLIAREIRTQRASRRWSQAELARKLDISQPKLSGVERGTSSLTAEQFLAVLQLFNLSASRFVGSNGDEREALTNALAQLGATHLVEAEDVLPSERLLDAQTVMREALLDGSARVVAAVAPVLVRHIRSVSLLSIHARLAELGHGGRLPWAVENTGAALALLARNEGDSRRWANAKLRTTVPFELLLADAQAARETLSHPPPLDVLDATIRDRKTLERVRARSSSESNRWRIVTTLQVDDFVRALEQADAAV